jgi:hypothetical protein
MRNAAKLAVTVVFITGCVTGAIARDVFRVPAALAQSPIDRWDYFCFADDNPNEVQTKLKAAGAQGWDLSTTTGTFWCMKRRM